jgi:hypothetical protein
MVFTDFSRSTATIAATLHRGTGVTKWNSRMRHMPAAIASLRVRPILAIKTGDDP